MKKSTSIILTSLVVITALCLGVVSWFMFAENSPLNKFSEGTTINGIDVSGLNKEQAKNLVSAKLISSRNDIDITLKYQDRTWNWKGADFEMDNQINPYVENMFGYFDSGNNIQNRANVKKLSNKQIKISYSTILTGITEKIDNLANEIDTAPVDAEVKFDQSKEQSFFATQDIKGVNVDKQGLIDKIDDKLSTATVVTVDIPTVEVAPKITKLDLEKKLVKRSSFSTSYAKSNADRKSNVKHALSVFNGMKIEPQQEVSFNQTTGSRTQENGYKKANIILNGVYIEGTGGGVCQASTTLYNSLLLADLEILEVSKHSLPASYVWLAFDAMVSEGYSDLRFKNNTESDIYLKTWGDDKNVYAEVYGEPLKEGLTIERKAEFIRVIPHNGDRIVEDITGEYSNKVTYKGEYLRLKYPQEGYECKAYLVKNDNGNITEELIRHDTYEPQEGVIIEGVETVTDGISIPQNTVKIIPPQNSVKVNSENVSAKLQKQNPSEYNP